MTSTENAECRQTAFGMILWLAFFPQLVFWVAFTVVLGFLGGTVATLLIGRKLPDRVDVI